MHEQTTRLGISYYGILSCILCFIGVSLVFVFAFIAPTGTNKLQGLEFLVVGPLVWMIHITGIVFGACGIRNAAMNPLCRTGTIANVLAIPGMLLLMRLAFVVSTANNLN